MLFSWTVFCTKKVWRRKINSAFQNFSKKTRFWNHKWKLVSIDFNHNPSSSIIDATLMYGRKNMGKISAWYDNEWPNRMCDIAEYIHKIS